MSEDQRSSVREEYRTQKGKQSFRTGVSVTADNASSPWVSATYGGHLEGVSGSWLQLGSAPAICRRLGSGKADRKISFYFSPSFKYLKKKKSREDEHLA